MSKNARLSSANTQILWKWMFYACVCHVEHNSMSNYREISFLFGVPPVSHEG
jgi:hypothetical protein